MKKYKRKAVELKARWSIKRQGSRFLSGKQPGNDVKQLKPKGHCLTEKRKRKNATVNICTYNVRTLGEEDNLDRLVEEADRIDWDIIGLCETHRKGEGITIIKDGHLLYDAGKTEDQPHARGVAFLINKKIKDNISNTKKHSDRIISLDIHINHQEKITVIMTYAPTSRTTEQNEEELEKFYDDLDEALINVESKYKIIIGDFNAKIGKKEDDSGSIYVGPYGIGKRNDRGERLLNWAEENKMYIANTMF